MSVGGCPTLLSDILEETEQALKRIKPDRLYFLYKLRDDWLVSKAYSQVLGRCVNRLKLSHGKREETERMIERSERGCEREPS